MLKENRDIVATNIILTLKACRDIVAAWSTGHLPAPMLVNGVRPQDIRIAPSFCRVNSLALGVRYTTRNITDAVRELADTNMTVENIKTDGKVRRIANRYVQIALLLAEAFEQGWMEEASTLANIKSCAKGYTLITLMQTLRAKQAAALKAIVKREAAQKIQARREAAREEKKAAAALVKSASSKRMVLPSAFSR